MLPNNPINMASHIRLNKPNRKVIINAAVNTSDTQAIKPLNAVFILPIFDFHGYIGIFNANTQTGGKRDCILKVIKNLYSMTR